MAVAWSWFCPELSLPPGQRPTRSSRYSLPEPQGCLQPRLPHHDGLCVLKLRAKLSPSSLTSSLPCVLSQSEKAAPSCCCATAKGWGEKEVKKRDHTGTKLELKRSEQACCICSYTKLLQKHRLPPKPTAHPLLNSWHRWCPLALTRSNTGSAFNLSTAWLTVHWNITRERERWLNEVLALIA